MKKKEKWRKTGDRAGNQENERESERMREKEKIRDEHLSSVFSPTKIFRMKSRQ